jgi:DNA-binding transcriptional LysR family regulator
MTLTAAGQALDSRIPGMLAGWDQVLRETRAMASRAARVLRVGFMSSAANEATQQIIAAFGRRRAGWRVDLQQAAWSDPTAGLADGDVDTLLHTAVPRPGRRPGSRVLLTEPAGSRSRRPRSPPGRISFRQLWDEPFVPPRRKPASGATPSGHRRTPGPPGHIGAEPTEANPTPITAIANGSGIALVPQSAARYYAAPASPTGPSGVSPARSACQSPITTANHRQGFRRCCLDNKPPA